VSDILIKNGWVFNGQGENMLTRSDLLVHDGKIQAIGTIQNSRLGAKVINGEGRIVSPGFIDLSSLLDNDVSQNSSEDYSSLLRQGITTAVIGGRGESIFQHFSRQPLQKTKLETKLGKGDVRERVLQLFIKSCPNLNLASFLGWTTLNNWGIKNSLQFSLFLDQIQHNFAGLSLEVREEHQEEVLKQLTEIAPILSKRGKNLMLFFPLSLPDTLLIRSLGELSLNHQITIAFNCPLLGCFTSVSDMILSLAEEENKKGANLIFQVWPYDSIQYELRAAEKLLGSQLNSIKNLEKTINSSFLFGFQIPMMLQGKTVGEIKRNWDMNTKDTLSKIDSLFPDNHFKILIPYHLNEGWWSSAFTYVGFDSTFIVHNNSYGPNIISGVNHFLKTHLSNTPADKWPSALAKITSQPALMAGLDNRGFLQKDYLADIVIINPDKVQSLGDYQNPSYQGEGIEVVIINGQVVWQKDRVWKRKVGKLLI